MTRQSLRATAYLDDEPRRPRFSVTRQTGILTGAALALLATASIADHARSHTDMAAFLLADRDIPTMATRGGRLTAIDTGASNASDNDALRAAWLQGHEKAARGGRLGFAAAALVEVAPVEVAPVEVAEVEPQDIASPARALTRTAKMANAQAAIAAEMKTKLAGTVAVDAPTPLERPEGMAASDGGDNPAIELAAYAPRPQMSPNNRSGAAAVIEAALEVRRPSAPEAEDAVADAAPLPASVPQSDIAAAVASVAVPAPRPNFDNRNEVPVEVASLEPQVGPTIERASTDAEAAMDVPLPVGRPQNVPAASVAAVQPRSTAAPAPSRAVPTRTAPQRPTRSSSIPSGSTDSGIGGFFKRIFTPHSTALPAANSGIAVYEISSSTVYLPGDGRLEAHSGLGQMQDDPRYVTQKNRGPTPPNIYNLRMREARFHGAEAIRLLPADGRKKYNRDGLLAHPYMYIGGGSRSQSNGCVVFKNYERFLRAFKAGRVTRMIVVPSLDQLPTYMAAL